MLNNPDKLKTILEACKKEGIHIVIPKLLRYSQEVFTKQNEMELAKLLREMGFKKTHTRKGNKWYS